MGNENQAQSLFNFPLTFQILNLRFVNDNVQSHMLQLPLFTRDNRLIVVPVSGKALFLFCPPFFPLGEMLRLCKIDLRGGQIGPETKVGHVFSYMKSPPALRSSRKAPHRAFFIFLCQQTLNIPWLMSMINPNLVFYPFKA